jgi:hypothetical protein
VFASVVSGPLTDTLSVPANAVANDVNPDQLVWAVTFDDTFVICPPNGAACLKPRPGKTEVFIDYATGDFIQSASFAVAPH